MDILVLMMCLPADQSGLGEEAGHDFFVDLRTRGTSLTRARGGWWGCRRLAEHRRAGQPAVAEFMWIQFMWIQGVNVASVGSVFAVAPDETVSVRVSTLCPVAGSHVPALTKRTAYSGRARIDGAGSGSHSDSA